MAPLKDYSPFTESEDGEPVAQQRDPCACITLWQCGSPACAAAGAASIGRTPRQRMSADAIAFVDFRMRRCGARLGQNGLCLNSGQADEETASFRPRCLLFWQVTAGPAYPQMRDHQTVGSERSVSMHFTKIAASTTATKDSIMIRVVVGAVDSKEPRSPPASTLFSPHGPSAILRLILVAWQFHPQLAPNVMVDQAKLFHCASHPRLNRARDTTVIPSP